MANWQNSFDVHFINFFIGLKRRQLWPLGLVGFIFFVVG